MHYTRWTRHQDPHITKSPFRLDHEARFLSKVKKLENGCWEWTAFRSPAGYGKFGMFREQLWLAHRWAYTRWKGPIPEGIQVDHECHNADLSCRGGPDCPHRGCVNPEHLSLKTARQNAIDSRYRKRDSSKCFNGHPYNRRSLFYYKDGDKGCLICTHILPKGARMPVWKLKPHDPKRRKY